MSLYFVNQFHLDTKNKVEALNEKIHPEWVDTDDIYTQVLEKFQEKYDLPAIHHWEDGYVQGDASDEELEVLAEKIEIELVSGDDRFQPLFTWLDKQYVELAGEAVEKVMNGYLVEEELLEQLSDFLEENVKGRDYSGDFRSHHAIHFNIDTKEFFEMYEASSNYILPNTNHIKVWDNGQEGGYTVEWHIEGICGQGFDALEEWQLEDVSTQEWESYNQTEQAEYLIEWHYDLCESSFDGWWDELKGDIIESIIEKLNVEIEANQMGLVIA